MAQGTIRIVRDTNQGPTGATNGPSGTAPKGGIRITPDSAPNPTVNQSGSGDTTRRKRHSETKRVSLSVEDRDGVTSEQVTSKVQPNRTTPAPNSGAPKARVYSRTSRRYMPESEAANTTKFLLSAVEMVGVTAAGPVGEMTDFERGMLTPPLQRVLQRTPLGIIEKTTPLIDICFLVMGGAIYFNRISGGVKFPSRPKSRAVQEDMQAPQTPPAEKLVDSTKPGDLDGIAIPVPSAISQAMNNGVI